jgi:dimethylhistidine N-methyltransferase
MSFATDTGADTIEAHPEAASDFAKSLLEGLSAPSKSIPSRFLYDAAGSVLFEKITELPEYYPTRTEAKILRDSAAEIAREAAPGNVLIEFGSGSSTKTELLLADMHQLYAYVPIDISHTALSDARARISKRFPDLRVLPVCGDFSQALALPSEIDGRPRLGFFPGSTIGNLTESAGVELLANMASILGSGARLIIGADLKKDVRRLLRAYDDEEGVTAAFNLNLLKRANRELDADFDVGQFDHLAIYNERQGRVEIYLVSLADQSVNLLGRRIFLAAGERIHTEYSHKYDIEGFQELGARAGWRPLQVWTDADALFSVHVLEAA